MQYQICWTTLKNRIHRWPILLHWFAPLLRAFDPVGSKYSTAVAPVVLSILKRWKNKLHTVSIHTADFLGDEYCWRGDADTKRNVHYHIKKGLAHLYAKKSHPVETDLSRGLGDVLRGLKRAHVWYHRLERSKVSLQRTTLIFTLEENEWEDIRSVVTGALELAQWPTLDWKFARPGDCEVCGTHNKFEESSSGHTTVTDNTPRGSDCVMLSDYEPNEGER